MKTLLYILSVVVFVLNTASCVLTNPTRETSPMTMLIGAVFLLLSAVLFCAAAVIGAIEKASGNKKGTS